MEIKKTLQEIKQTLLQVQLADREQDRAELIKILKTKIQELEEKINHKEESAQIQIQHLKQEVSRLSHL